MRIAKIIFISTFAFAIGIAASAAPPEGKGSGKGGGGGGGEEPTIEVPTTVYIATSRNGQPSLVVAGADGLASQKIYDFANYSAYLHDAVLIAPGHGRALITDRAANPLPLIAVDFWFGSDGVITASQSNFLVDRPDWGCEALSSDGTRAIYAPANTGTVTEIDIASGTSRPIWSFDPTHSMPDCDYRSENNLNGVIHAVVVDAGWYRIDKIDLVASSVTTVVSARPQELREIAVHYSGGDVAIAAISEPSAIRAGSSFGDAAANDPIVLNGTNPDFYCDGGSFLLRGQSKNKRILQVYDFEIGTPQNYGGSNTSSGRTLC